MHITPINIRPIVIDINTKFNSRYISPKQSVEIDEQYLLYKNAEKLANDIEIKKGMRHFVVVDGTFYFGDFIEALVVKNNWKIKHMIISTLSLNQNNVDSLRNLIIGDYVQKLDLIVSDYFFSHERDALVPYIYEKLDIDDKFQLSSAGTHCKLCIFETENGGFVVIHGSANLRSSSNIEQFMIEENEELYKFNFEMQSAIVNEYFTIKKSVRRKKLWQAVQTVITEKQD